MRSWMTAMPGETLSCGGCHEPRNATPAVKSTLALGKKPAEIRPWYGPARGFSFRGEVQPVLDRHCVGCHNGRPRDDGLAIPDLRGEQNAFVVFRAGDPKPRVIRGVRASELVDKYGGIFEPAYFTLRSFVRVPGLESDLHLLPPTEFHADTNELVQMLHGVMLDAEAWDRLITWIDLNAPCHGTWSEFVSISGDQRRRRRELRRLYGGIDEDGESPPRPPETPAPSPKPVEPIVPRETVRPTSTPVRLTAWPMTPGEASRRQLDTAPIERTLDLGDGASLRLVRIPAGSFVMGDAAGSADEQPLGAVRIEKPFWIAACETTNRQFARFDPAHQSRYEHRGSWIFGEEYLGYPLDGPRQPVVRVSWNEAVEFCRWLGRRTRLSVSLPTEAQWEYACRAGTDAPFSFGAIDSDFAPFANMADVTIRDLAYRSWSPKTPDIVPRDGRFNDHALVSAAVGSFRPNAWGVFDMHGNVAEWTRTSFRGYPYREDDGRKLPTAALTSAWSLNRPSRGTMSGVFGLHER
jgi:formylglycine-generating enzyme required for sulfatase activity